MNFEVVAMRPNTFGKMETILFHEKYGYVWTAKAKPSYLLGDQISIPTGESHSTSYLGVRWASEGFEAGIPYRPQHTYVEPKHVPQHYLCIMMYRRIDDDRESLSMLRIEADRREEIPEIIAQHTSLFHTTIDRYEVKDLGII